MPVALQVQPIHGVCLATCFKKHFTRQAKVSLPPCVASDVLAKAFLTQTRITGLNKMSQLFHWYINQPYIYPSLSHWIRFYW